jgi:hypothetical protein
MPRGARIAPGEIVYHVLNRANARSELFIRPEDYSAFERIMISAMQRNAHPAAGVLFDARSLAHGSVADERR